MPEREETKLVLSTNERIMSCIVGGEDDIMTERWELSSPIPGVRIINTWQVYHLIWLALAQDEAGHYLIYRSIDLQKYTLVHNHITEIYNLFWLDDGHVLFSAADGWWATTDTGLVWNRLSLWESSPAARNLTAVGLQEGSWTLVAYGQDHKIYACAYPGGQWSEVFDTTAIHSDKWYPAMAGGSAGILAGAGNKLLRSLSAGAAGSWQIIQEVEGIIKSIVASNQSNIPTFLIVIESLDGSADRFYRSYDLGDSLEADMTRVDSVASVASITPTGTPDMSTAFAVLGKRTADTPPGYKLIQEV